MSDEDFYKIIAAEIETNDLNTAVWMQAFSLAEGNSEKAKAIYIRLRLAQLKKTSELQSNVQYSDENGMEQLRAKLTEKLRVQNKSSLYSSLGISPSLSDAEVSNAIRNIEERGGGVSSAEFKYAKEILSNPLQRTAYDRKLMDTLLNGELIRNQAYTYSRDDEGNDSGFISWWESRKTSLVLWGVLIIAVGYLLLGYVRERNRKATQHEVIQAVSEIEEGKLGNEQLKIETGAEVQNRYVNISEQAEQRQRQEMENRASLEYQRLMMQRDEQDRRFAKEEERKQQELDRQKKQQEQAEERKLQRERQYWVCMNSQLNSGKPSEAYARCAAYKNN